MQTERSESVKVAIRTLEDSLANIEDVDKTEGEQEKMTILNNFDYNPFTTAEIVAARQSIM